MKNILYIIIGLSLSLTACTGDNGEMGPKGDTGQDGKNGINGVAGSKGATGSQGSQGSQGPTGAVGEQGNTPELKVSYTTWNNLGTIEKSQATLPTYRANANTTIASLFPEKYNSLTFSENGYFLISDGTSGLPVGMLYHYIKIEENGSETIFRDVFMNAENEYSSTFILGASKNISGSVYTAFKGAYAQDYDFVKAVESKKLAVRYVFLPLSLKSRTKQINMDNYGDVKAAFNLED